MPQLAPRVLFGVVAGLVAAGAFVRAQQPPAAPQEQAPPTFRGGTTFVSVDVYPRVDGQVVEGLNATDFQVFEDGRPQAIESFEFVRIEPNPVDSDRRDPTSQADGDRQAADPRNRVFVVYLDTIHTTVAGGQHARQPLVDFLNRTIGAQDLFGVMTSRTPVGQLVFGRRLESIEGELERYWTWGRADRVEVLVTPESDYEKRLLDCADRMPQTVIAQLPYPGDETRRFQAFTRLLVSLHREEQLMSNLLALMDRLGNLRDERKNVLFISEGWVPEGPREELRNIRLSDGVPSVWGRPGGRFGLAQTNPYAGIDLTWCETEIRRLGTIDFELDFRSLLERASRSNVSFYPVDVGGLRTSPGRAIETLRTLAENTDGFAVVATNDLMGHVRQIERDLSAFYLLGYYSTNEAANGRFRRIEVKVSRPDVRVSARRGYLAPTPELAAAAAAPRGAAAPSAVDEAVGRLALIRPDAEIVASGTATGEQLQVAVELSAPTVARTAWQSGATVEVIAAPSNGEPVAATVEIAAGSRSTVVTVADAGRGPWQVVVRATAGGQRLEQRLDVAAPAVRWVGPPQAWRGAPSPRSPLRPLVDSRMTRLERLRVEWPIVGPADTHVVRLLDRSGKPLGQPLPFTNLQPDKPALAVELPMAALPEGDYVLELVASQAGESEQRLLAFRVVR